MISDCVWVYWCINIITHFLANIWATFEGVGFLVCTLERGGRFSFSFLGRLLPESIFSCLFKQISMTGLVAYPPSVFIFYFYS